MDYILTFIGGAIFGAVFMFFVVKNNRTKADKVGDTIDDIKDSITGD